MNALFNGVYMVVRDKMRLVVADLKEAFQLQDGQKVIELGRIYSSLSLTQKEKDESDPLKWVEILETRIKLSEMRAEKRRLKRQKKKEKPLKRGRSFISDTPTAARKLSDKRVSAGSAASRSNKKHYLF